MGIFDNFKNLVASSKPSPLPDPVAVKKILVVEDDPVFSNALTLKFKSAGYEVILAANGEEGLNAINLQKPDLIVLDLMMPVMDGKTMLKKLRDIPEFTKLPVVILSNAGDSNTIMETKTYYSASEYLIKSNVTPDEILTKVRQHIGI
jgi:two-component system chemotaxis response regulator CheY